MHFAPQIPHSQAQTSRAIPHNTTLPPTRSTNVTQPTFTTIKHTKQSCQHKTTLYQTHPHRPPYKLHYHYSHLTYTRLWWVWLEKCRDGSYVVNALRCDVWVVCTCIAVYIVACFIGFWGSVFWLKCIPT